MTDPEKRINQILGLAVVLVLCAATAVQNANLIQSVQHVLAGWVWLAFALGLIVLGVLVLSLAHISAKNDQAAQQEIQRLQADMKFEQEMKEYLARQ
ncbi:MAG TPA: hypothetical protein VL306_02785 [Methylomirabilota bacterium]|jgi:hypothetical protein|nr:hypothetical protein [Methylomirabilota bacterium]